MKAGCNFYIGFLLLFFFGSVSGDENACDSNSSCVSCSKQEGCVWESERCVSSESASKKGFELEKFSSCNFDRRTRLNFKKNCLNVIKSSIPTKLMLNKGEEDVIKEEVYCFWNITRIQKGEKVKLNFKKIFDDKNRYFIKFYFENNTFSYKEILEKHYSVTIKNLKATEVWFISEGVSVNQTFEIEISYSQGFQSQFLFICFLGFLLVIIIVMIIAAIFEKFSQKNFDIFDVPAKGRKKYFWRTREHINKLRIKKLLSSECPPMVYSSKINQLKDKCSICLESFKEGKDRVFKLPCEHIFHENCLEKWFYSHLRNPQCPNCNVETFKLLQNQGKVPLNCRRKNYLDLVEDYVPSSSRDMETEKKCEEKTKNSNNTIDDVDIQIPKKDANN